MAWNEGLVDLSLFAYSPTNDQHFSITDPSDVPDVSEIPGGTFTRRAEPVREFYGPRSAPLDRPDPYASKPLPRLPPRTICGAISIPRECDHEPSCILTRMKRKRTYDSPDANETNLLRRRNITAPPQLTLSAPQQASSDRGPASEMVWMPEEQMWLIVGEGVRESQTGPTRYPTPPVYSPPSDYARSEPATTMPSRWSITPPVSPIQTQLRSLIEPRDEERLSPLFQEAMNSVPMDDTFDLPPPPTYEGTVRRKSLRSSPMRSAPISSSPPPPVPPLPAEIPTRLLTSRPQPKRTASTGSTYTTAPSRHSPSDSISTLSRSQTNLSNRSRLKPATSKYGTWDPNINSVSPNAMHSHFQTLAGSSSQGDTLDFERQGSPESSKSWQNFARKFARP